MKKLGETELLKESKPSPALRQESPTKTLWEPKVLFLLSLNLATSSLPGWHVLPFLVLSSATQLLLHTPAGRQLVVAESLPLAYAPYSWFVLTTALIGVFAFFRSVGNKTICQIPGGPPPTYTGSSVLFVSTLLIQHYICTPRLLAVGLLLITRPEQIWPDVSMYWLHLLLALISLAASLGLSVLYLNFCVSPLPNYKNIMANNSLANEVLISLVPAYMYFVFLMQDALENMGYNSIFSKIILHTVRCSPSLVVITFNLFSVVFYNRKFRSFLNYTYMLVDCLAVLLYAVFYTDEMILPTFSLLVIVISTFFMGLLKKLHGRYNYRQLKMLRLPDVVQIAETCLAEWKGNIPALSPQKAEFHQAYYYHKDIVERYATRDSSNRSQAEYLLLSAFDTMMRKVKTSSLQLLFYLHYLASINAGTLTTCKILKKLMGSNLSLQQQVLLKVVQMHIKAKFEGITQEQKFGKFSNPEFSGMECSTQNPFAELATVPSGSFVQTNLQSFQLYDYLQDIMLKQIKQVSDFYKMISQSVTQVEQMHKMAQKMHKCQKQAQIVYDLLQESAHRSTTFYMLPYAMFVHHTCNNNRLMRDIIRKYHLKRKTSQYQKLSLPFFSIKDNSVFLVASAEPQDLGLIRYAAGNCDKIISPSVAGPDGPLGRNIFEMLGPELESAHRTTVIDYLNNPDRSYVGVKKTRYCKMFESTIYKKSDVITVFSSSLNQGLSFVTCVETPKQTDFLLMFNQDQILVGMSELFAELEGNMSTTIANKLASDISADLAAMLEKAVESKVAQPGKMLGGDTTTLADLVLPKEGLVSKVPASEINSGIILAPSRLPTASGLDGISQLPSSQIQGFPKRLLDTGSTSDLKEQHIPPDGREDPLLAVKFGENLRFEIPRSSISLIRIALSTPRGYQCRVAVLFNSVQMENLLKTTQERVVVADIPREYDPGVKVGGQDLGFCVWKPKSQRVQTVHKVEVAKQDPHSTKSLTMKTQAKKDEPELDSLRSTQNPKVDWQKYTISVSDVRWFALSELIGISLIFLYSIAAQWVSMSELTEKMSNYARDLTAVRMLQPPIVQMSLSTGSALYTISEGIAIRKGLQTEDKYTSIDPSIQNNREEYFRLHNKRTIRGWSELMDQSKTLTKEFFDLMQNYLYNETFSIGLGTNFTVNQSLTVLGIADFRITQQYLAYSFKERLEYTDRIYRQAYLMVEDADQRGNTLFLNQVMYVEGAKYIANEELVARAVIGMQVAVLVGVLVIWVVVMTRIRSKIVHIYGGFFLLGPGELQFKTECLDSLKQRFQVPCSHKTEGYLRSSDLKKEAQANVILWEQIYQFQQNIAVKNHSARHSKKLHHRRCYCFGMAFSFLLLTLVMQATSVGIMSSLNYISNQRTASNDLVIIFRQYGRIYTLYWITFVQIYDGILMRAGLGRNVSLMATQLTRLQSVFSRIQSVLPVIEQYNLMLEHSAFGPHMPQIEVQMNPCKFNNISETGISAETCRTIAAGALGVSTFKSFHWMNSVIEGYINRLKISDAGQSVNMKDIFKEKNFLEFELLMNRLNYPLYMEVLQRFRAGLKVLTADWETNLQSTWVAILLPLMFISLLLIWAAMSAVWENGKLALDFLHYLPGPSYLVNTKIRSLIKELGIRLG